jgi:GNAT superfamily N-acetyltransferase
MEKDAITVREARSGDAETLARFNELMALETEGLRLDPPAIRAGVRAVLADPARGRYFVAERQGAVAGALLLTYEWSDWRNATFLWLQSVYVEPAARRRGVFTSLFRHVEELASRPGHCGLRLYVDADNAGAREVYGRLGLVHRNYLVLESPDSLRED